MKICTRQILRWPLYLGHVTCGGTPSGHPDQNWSRSVNVCNSGGQSTAGLAMLTTHIHKHTRSPFHSYSPLKLVQWVQQTWCTSSDIMVVSSSCAYIILLVNNLFMLRCKIITFGTKQNVGKVPSSKPRISKWSQLQQRYLLTFLSCQEEPSIWNANPTLI